jgi:hypothetical protein
MERAIVIMSLIFSRLQRLAGALWGEKGVLLSGKAVLFWQKDDWF